MKIQRKSASLLAITMIVAIPSFASQVRTDYDRSVDFNKYKTYSWKQVQTQNPLWIDRIEAAVNSELAAKGWTEVNSGGSVAIMAMEINKTHKTLETYYDSFDGGWGWRGGWGGGPGDDLGESTTTESTYRIGTLVIDLFDSNTKSLIWRGSLSDVLSDKYSKNIRSLDKGVKKMFDHFPPNAQTDAKNR